jgi:hypothetical protein
MAKAANTGYQALVERIIRNEDIFCSLLFDHTNRTLRVVDFRGGNFQSKHVYLEGVLMKEGMRKIFTLIERDDMNGWQRVGYHREGSIPGYYKRSDAYVMSRIYDRDFEPKEPQGEEVPENKNLLNDIKVVGKKLADAKEPSVKVEPIEDEDVQKAIEEEIERQEGRAKKGKASKPPKAAAKPAKVAKAVKNETDADIRPVAVGSGDLIFPQFSREVEYFHFLVQNRRTKQSNLITTEYQDCFGNAKVHFVFDPESKTDQNLCKVGLNAAIDQLVETGAVSIFATVPVDQTKTNEVFASVGFRNTGWLTNQLLTPNGPIDVMLWTKKLI